jgi:periplasmic copper chaperone A
MAAIIFLLGLVNLFAPQIKIENAWLRAASKGTNSALYFDIKNLMDKDDELLNVSSDIAKVVQIHETYRQGENMGMRRVELIVIKSKSIFKLAPGGFHVMVIRLREELKAGDRKNFLLTFRNSGKIKVTAVVKSG